MKVYVRSESAERADCGEMNPEQFHHFFADLRENGLYIVEPGLTVIVL